MVVCVHSAKARRGWGLASARAGAAALLILAAGCSFGNKGESVPASSGDPEADARAEQRVGSSRDKSGNQPARERTLYERLGGEEGISRLVDDMMPRSVNDPRVNFSRTDIKTNFLGRKYPAWDATPENVDVLKQHMREFLALAAGGPTQYTGRDVREVHKGMRITNSEFDAMVGDIKASMDKLGFAAREKRDLLAVIETTRKQIVEK